MCRGGRRLFELPRSAAKFCRLGGRGGRDEEESGWERRWKGFMRGEEDSKGEHCVAADGYALILRTSTSPSSCSWWVQWAVRLGDERTAEASGREV